MQNSAGHFNGLHRYRALAILIVFLGHLGPIGFGWIFLQGLVLMTCYFCFRALEQQESGRSIYFLRRLIRLLPVYFTYLILAFLLKKQDMAPVMNSLVSLTYNFKPFFHTLHWSHSHTHLWTLSLDIQLILLIVCFSMGSERFKYRASWVLILTAPLIKGILTFYLLQLQFEPWQIFLIGFYTPLFQYETLAWGYLLYLSTKQQQPLLWGHKSMISSAMIMLLFGLSNILLGKGDWEDLGFNNEFGFYNPIWIYSIVNLFNFSLFNKLIAQAPQAQRKALIDRFGDISFTFYLYHFPIQHFYMQRYDFINIYSLAGLKVMFAAFFTTLMISVPLYYLIERPADLWQKSLSQKKLISNRIKGLLCNKPIK